MRSGKAVAAARADAAEAAADEAVAEDAPGGGGVSFVLLLPTADACAEASKKKDKQGDEKYWRVDFTSCVVCLTNETRTCGG